MEDITSMMAEFLAEDYDHVNREIKLSVRKTASEVVYLGFLLRRMMDEKLYLACYDNFDSYLRNELRMDYTLANRFMGINRKYSLDGNSEKIDEKYTEYSQGLLVEMLSMPPELEAKVEPDMTVKQVREIKRQAKQKSVKMKPDARGLMGYAYCASCGEPLDETDRPKKCPKCGQLQDWNRWAEMIVDGEYREIGTPAPESIEVADIAMSQPDCEVHDERWFVEQYVKFAPEESAELMETCRREKNGSDRAKSIQERIAPYGHHGCSCDKYDFTFHGFAKGIDFRVGCDEIHLTYRRFALELMRIAEGAIATSQSEKSAYGLEKTEYPEGSLLTTEGCGHKHNCFSCAQDCNIRQKDRYCALAPLGNPFPCTTMAVLENLKEELEDKCQFVNNDLAPHKAGNGEADPCCRDCKELCGYRCQHAKLQEEPERDEYEMSLLRDMLDEAKDVLKRYKAFGDIPDKTVHKQKLLVGALANMACELEELQEKEEAAAETQQELPLLKNDTQRKQWLSDYKAWGLWYRDDNIDVNYYKFDFIDGSRLVVAEHPQRHSYWSREVRDEAFYHLIPKNKVTSGEIYDEKYRHATHSETELIKFLKDLQKKG